MLRKIGTFITANSLLPPRGRVVVGLSGGADSVCLVRVLHALGYGVVAVHCNFHLRGDESMRDERFARQLCQRLGVEWVKADFDTAAYAAARGMSIEMAAREQRYDLFAQVMAGRGCDAIAVGHHKDDNIETLLLNLARGTGLRGLCAIQPRNGDVVRPLLCVGRSEIEDYLRLIGQDYVTDHTNNEDAYARNKLRLNVLPELQRINAGVRGNIIDTIENLCEVRKVYDRAIADAIADCCAEGRDGSFAIDKRRLMSSPSPVSVLHELLGPHGFNRSHYRQILGSIGECGRTFHSGNGSTLVIDRHCIVVETRQLATIAEPVPIEAVAQVEMSEVDAAGLEIDRSPAVAYIDADRVGHRLTVRTPRRGDTFAPFGMGGRRKLVSDFLTDLKLSVFDKARQLLVCDADEIVWVVGRRSSEFYRVGCDTRRVLVLRMNDA